MADAGEIRPASEDVEGYVSGKDITRASRLLGNYPLLVRRLKAARLAVIHGGNAEIQSQRKQTGIHSDPTGRRAVELVTLSERARELRTVRKYIEQRVKTFDDRRLLLTLWSTANRGGWYLVANLVNRDQQAVKLSWLRMAAELAALLPKGEDVDDHHKG